MICLLVWGLPFQKGLALQASVDSFSKSSKSPDTVMFQGGYGKNPVKKNPVKKRPSTCQQEYVGIDFALTWV